MTPGRAPAVLVLALVLSALDSAVTQLLTSGWFGMRWWSGMVALMRALDVVVVLGLAIGAAELRPRLGGTHAIAARIATVVWTTYAAAVALDLVAVIATGGHLWGQFGPQMSYFGLAAYAALLYACVDRRRPLTIALAATGAVLLLAVTPISPLWDLVYRDRSREELRVARLVLSSIDVALEAIAIALVLVAARRTPAPEEREAARRGLALSASSLLARVIVSFVAIPTTVVAADGRSGASDWIAAAIMLAASVAASIALAAGLARASRWSAPRTPRWMFGLAGACIAAAAGARLFSFSFARDRSELAFHERPIPWLAPTLDLIGLLLALAAIARTAQLVSREDLAERARRGAFIAMVCIGGVIALEPTPEGEPGVWLLWALVSLVAAGAVQWMMSRQARELAPLLEGTAPAIPTAVIHAP